ncbi:Capsule biosynthesis protein CapA [Paenibacillus sp. P1XP2]|nr:Capsule biosynthesis protein CapA [Paenibacillus sp. P1XP2]
MYPPRSQKKRTGSKNRKKKQRRLWLTLNACLLLMIVILLATYFLAENRGAAGVPPQQPSSANTERNETAAKDNGTAPDSDAGSKKDEPEAEAADPAKEEPAEKPDKPGKAQSQTQQTGETQENDGQKQPPQQNKDNPPADAADQGDGGKDAGAEDSEAAKEHSIMKDDGKSVTIHFVGDMIFSGKVETLLEKNGYSYPFHYLGDMFKKDDLTLGNLETPVTTGGVSAQNKQFVFKSSPQALEALRAAGMDVVNLGNNHILDQARSVCWIRLTIWIKAASSTSAQGKTRIALINRCISSAEA